MMFRRRTLVLLFAPVLALGARSAHADPSAAEISSAKHAFESAVSLESERHWPEAALKLREAIAVKDTPGLRFHLAHCELEQGHLVEASLEYDRASELLRQGAAAPDVQKLLVPATAALKPRIPRLTVELPADLIGPSAALDGKPYPPSELALGVPLNPGRHTLRVSAPGREPFERALLLKEGEPLTVRADLAVSAPPLAPAVTGPVVAAPANASEPTAREQPRSSAKVYLLVGESVLTAAGLAVGIGYRFSASSASDRIASAQGAIDDAAPGDQTACAPGPAQNPACNSLQTAIDDHDRAVVISDIGFVTAAVGAAALVTTWLAYPSATNERAGIRVQPVAGLGRIGLIGSF